jgi:ferric-dicitrate binding protein FerR (iron transport regulator)
MNVNEEAIQKALDRDNDAADAAPGERLAGDESLGFNGLVRTLRVRPTANSQVSHLTMNQLRELAEARKAQGEAFELPLHVAVCPVCLEAYEVMLDGEAKVSPATKSRFETIFQSRLALDFRQNPFTVFRRRRWSQIASVAAVLLVAVGVVWAFTNLITPSSTATIATGVLTTEDGTVIPVGTIIPAGKVVVAKEAVETKFADGSDLHIQEHSRFSVVKNFQGNTTVDLASGSVDAHVAKQASGNHFYVHTALGQVTVVGTRFSVTCVNDSTVVYPKGVSAPATPASPTTPAPAAVASSSTPNITLSPDQSRVTRVKVAVTEGLVKVSNSFETVAVAAGQNATLDENASHVKVEGDAVN